MRYTCSQPKQEKPPQDAKPLYAKRKHLALFERRKGLLISMVKLPTTEITERYNTKRVQLHQPLTSVSRFDKHILTNLLTPFH